MSLTSISPLDGRYQKQIQELSSIFSESALMRYRLMVEAEYLIALSSETKIKEVKKFSDKERVALRIVYEKFDEQEAQIIKNIEKTTNHDVKSIEYYFKDKIANIDSLKKYSEFIHFALTSEDINNLAYSLMLKDGVGVYIENVNQLLAELKKLALKNKNIPMLSLTHGQPASPTTVGKEAAVVYARIKNQLNKLKQIKLKAKFSGAVGNWNAQVAAYSNLDWISFSKKFVQSLRLEFNPLTTQIESHDSAAEIYHGLIRINNIIKNLNQDMWAYISRGVFCQKRIKGEVGSSTMPHKINPINFENSEGNIGLSNALLNHLADKLTISRMQRDLSDSTVLRNQGVALGYAILSIKSTLKGLAKLEINKKQISCELDNHWEILAEPIQVILRKTGYKNPYEALKELTRGEKITKKDLHKFINNLKTNKQEKNKLLKLTPANYIGLASKLTLCVEL